MRKFFRVLLTQLSVYLNPKTKLHSRSIHETLFLELKKAQGRNSLIAELRLKTSDAFKLLRRLSVIHLILMNSKQFFSVLQENMTMFSSKDEWINSNVLSPYFIFLKKCCSNEDKYTRIDNYIPSQKEEVFEMLFYCINTLKQLFKVVSKMPFLGRYYLSIYPEVCNGFIETVAIQAQKLYNSFKMCLNLLLNNLGRYITDEESQTIFKEVLRDDLIMINEEMKKLFLDKYFYPLGKGIGVKLFRPEEQSPELTLVINRIVSNHQDTERKKQRELLENTLFPNDAFNFQYFQETLQQVSHSITSNIFRFREEEVTEIQKNINNYEESIEGKQVLAETNTETYDKAI